MAYKVIEMKKVLSTVVLDLVIGNLQNNIQFDNLWSISSTFYTHIFGTKVLCTAFFYLHVTGEKLPKRLSYKKGVRKMLMKLTP